MLGEIVDSYVEEVKEVYSVGLDAIVTAEGEVFFTDIIEGYNYAGQTGGSALGVDVYLQQIEVLRNHFKHIVIFAPAGSIRLMGHPYDEYTTKHDDVSVVLQPNQLARHLKTVLKSSETLRQRDCLIVVDMLHVQTELISDTNKSAKFCNPFHVKQYLATCGFNEMPVLSAVTKLQMANSKAVAMKLFSNSQHYPKSIVFDSRQTRKFHIETVRDQLDSDGPFIIKPGAGSMGAGVVRIQSLSQLRTVMQALHQGNPGKIKNLRKSLRYDQSAIENLLKLHTSIAQGESEIIIQRWLEPCQVMGYRAVARVPAVVMLMSDGSVKTEMIAQPYWQLAKEEAKANSDQSYITNRNVSVEKRYGREIAMMGQVSAKLQQDKEGKKFKTAEKIYQQVKKQLSQRKDLDQEFIARLCLFMVKEGANLDQSLLDKLCQAENAFHPVAQLLGESHIRLVREALQTYFEGRADLFDEPNIDWIEDTCYPYCADSQPYFQLVGTTDTLLIECVERHPQAEYTTMIALHRLQDAMNRCLYGMSAEEANLYQLISAFIQSKAMIQKNLRKAGEMCYQIVLMTILMPFHFEKKYISDQERSSEYSSLLSKCDFYIKRSGYEKKPIDAGLSGELIQNYNAVLNILKSIVCSDKSANELEVSDEVELIKRVVKLPVTDFYNKYVTVWKLLHKCLAITFALLPCYSGDMMNERGSMRFNIGKCYMVLGDFHLALAFFISSFETGFTHRTMPSLMKICFDEENARAVAHYMIAKDSSSPQIHYSYASRTLFTNMSIANTPDLTAIIDTKSKNITQYNLASSYLQLGELEQAQYWFSQAMQSAWNPSRKEKIAAKLEEVNRLSHVSGAGR